MATHTRGSGQGCRTWHRVGGKQIGDCVPTTSTKQLPCQKRTCSPAGGQPRRPPPPGPRLLDRVTVKPQNQRESGQKERRPRPRHGGPLRRARGAREDGLPGEQTLACADAPNPEGTVACVPRMPGWAPHRVGHARPPSPAQTRRSLTKSPLRAQRADGSHPSSKGPHGRAAFWSGPGCAHLPPPAVAQPHPTLHPRATAQGLDRAFSGLVAPALSH